MSGGKRVPLSEGRRIAGELLQMLAPACTRIVLCGSIRRECEMIGDIDLVVQPLLFEQLDMFGAATSEPVNALSELLDAYTEEGSLTKRLDRNGRPAWGVSLKRAVYRGLNVDVQSVSVPDTFGAWLVIRTGPASFNKRLMTPRRQGGLLPAGCEFKDGFQLWRWGERVPTPREEDVFAALGLDYVEPQERM